MGVTHTMNLNNDQTLKKVRIVGLSILAFVMMFTYAIVRPATESLFLDVYTSAKLPVVWLMVALVTLVTVVIYNRFVVKKDLLTLFGWSAFLSAVIFSVLFVLSSYKVPGSVYALYVWKDVYVILLVEIYYSFSNAVFPIKTARWAYGFFGAISAVGGLLGNILVGILAKKFGTEHVLWTIPPLLIITWMLNAIFARYAECEKVHKKVDKTIHFKEAVSVIRRSSYLILILLLIVVTQIVITLIDFKYNNIVEHVYPVLDERTKIIGYIYGAINFSAILFHILTGPVLRLAGVPIILVAVPFFLGTGIGIFIIVPIFIVMAVVKVASKVFDYSIFRAAKEILYIPLSYAEKTQGKSIIDMLAYRVAKGGASVLLMGLIMYQLDRLSIWCAIALIGIWIFITTIIIKRYRHKVSRQAEMVSENTLNTQEDIDSRES